MALKSKRNRSVVVLKYGEVWGIILIGLSIILLVSFYFYDPKNLGTMFVTPPKGP